MSKLRGYKIISPPVFIPKEDVDMLCKVNPRH